MRARGALGSVDAMSSIKDSSVLQQQVRFNKFTGKAIYRGSQGSRFGLVSWVRKLYTTDSRRKIRKFLMDGIVLEHNETFKKNFQKHLAEREGSVSSGSLGLLTVGDCKDWYHCYTDYLRDVHTKGMLEQKSKDGC